MKTRFYAVLGLVFFLSLIAMQLVVAMEFGGEVSPEDQQTFDQILAPVMKIYTLVKYCATAIAGIVLLFAGVTYITSGSDPAKRDQAKNMAMYVVIGLVVIWGAPLLVNFIVG